MSVTFDIQGRETWKLNATTGEYDLAVPPGLWLNLANGNARDFIRWVGLPVSDYDCGSMPAREVAARCRRRLWPERRDANDEGLPSSDTQRPGQCRVIECGRPAGRLAEYAERLLAIAESAGPDGLITWG